VLGIDNLVFIAILTNKLPETQRDKARRLGIGLALVLRLALLGTVALIVRMTEPLFGIFGNEFSWRDLILLAGGLFLIWKATKEIHHNTDPDHGPDMFEPASRMGFNAAIGQIIVLDIVFSIDSIVTAVGMTDHIPIMVIAVVVTVIIMMFAAGPLANFIQNNPTLVMLALGFLLLIGTMLVADAFGVHIPKAYIYSAMAFSVLVELLNMMARKARHRRESSRKGKGAAP
jgi:predicted tellurium resistance membrane protein TerC